MSARPLSAMYLILLCAVLLGCGTSSQPKVDDDGLAAARSAAPNQQAAKEAEQQAAKEAEQLKAVENALEKKAAEEKAAANSYIKVKVDVELRGVLTCTDEAFTLSIITPEFGTDRFKEVKWVLDFGEDKEIRANAKSLDGKTVLVKGSAILRGIESETGPRSGRAMLGGIDLEPGSRRRGVGEPADQVTRSVLDLEPKVAVKSLVSATKK